MPDWLFRLNDIQDQLPDDPAGFRFTDFLRHGSMRAGLYAPQGRDPQQPHKQDELYIVAAGQGTFVKNGVRRDFVANDVIFVEAGAEHRFETFSDDFSAWVIFWGPDGGEA